MLGDIENATRALSEVPRLVISTVVLGCAPCIRSTK